MKKLIILFVLLTSFANLLYSQWNITSLGGGNAGPIITTKPGTFFIATELGIYRSTNNTSTWENVNDSNIASFWRNYPSMMTGRGDTVVFSSNGHVIGSARFYVTTNNGKNWRKIEQGKRVGTFIFKDNCWLYSGNKITQKGLYRSTDVGITWEYIGSPYSITSLWVYNNYIYGSGREGVYRSSDYGTNWDTVSKENHSPIAIGNLLVSIGSDFIAKSTDDGFNWEKTSNTFPFLPFCAKIIVKNINN